MSLRVLPLAGVLPQPWRNGGGQTCELLCWPSANHWSLRISVADIDRDGPFSAYAGVERWFAVMAGAGVVLSFAGRDLRLTTGDAPLCFDGAAAPGCRLIAGSTRDLNLMLRSGAGVMARAAPGQRWSAAFAMRGVFAAAAGRLQMGPQRIDVPAQSLLWSDPADDAAWAFESDEGSAAAWWFGFTPEGSAR